MRTRMRNVLHGSLALRAWAAGDVAAFGGLAGRRAGRYQAGERPGRGLVQRLVVLRQWRGGRPIGAEGVPDVALSPWF